MKPTKHPRQLLTRRLRRSTRARVYLWCLLWAALVGVAQKYNLRPLPRQEMAALDFRFRVRGPQSPPPEIVILGIDQDSSSLGNRFHPLPRELEPLRKYPYPRSVYAHAIERLCEAGARLVAFDTLFDHSEEDDAALQAAVSNHADRVVLGSNFDDKPPHQLLEPEVVVPESVPLERVVGYVNFWPDDDGVVRKALAQVYPSQLLGMQIENERLEMSFAAKSARKLSPSLPLPDRTESTYLNYLGGPGTFPMISFYQLFYAATWTNQLQGGAFFHDKVVLIGATGNFHHDQHPTPFGAMDGVEIQATTLATLLNGTALHAAPWWLELVTLLAVAVATAALLNLVAHPLPKLALLAAVCVVYVWIAFLAFGRLNLILPVMAPVWTVAAGGVFGITVQLVAEQLEKRRMRQTLEKYVSKPVATEILGRAEEYENSLGGERKHVTILFSDIRDFTTLSEQSNPIELVQQLNEYFTAMVDIVMKHEGTLDKYVGDSIMAVYGAPIGTTALDDAWRAVQTAHEMRTRLAELQKTWAGQGRPVFKTGIGINHGEVVVGNIGSPRRMEYTVIGDAVNLASRVEGLNKQFGTDVLLTESVHALVKDRVEVQLMGATSVKGRAQSVNVYFLKDIRPV